MMAALVAERGRLEAPGPRDAGGVEGRRPSASAGRSASARPTPRPTCSADFCAHGGCDHEGLKAALAALKAGGARGDLDKHERIAAFLEAAPDGRGAVLAADRRAFLTQAGERAAAALTKSSGRVRSSRRDGADRRGRALGSRMRSVCGRYGPPTRPAPCCCSAMLSPDRTSG